jgi:hypothetical protein
VPLQARYYQAIGNVLHIPSGRVCKIIAVDNKRNEIYVQHGKWSAWVHTDKLEPIKEPQDGLENRRNIQV